MVRPARKTKENYVRIRPESAVSIVDFEVSFAEGGG